MEKGRGGKWEGEHLGSGGRVQVRAPGALTRMGRSKLLSSTGQCWETSRNLGGGGGELAEGWNSEVSLLEQDKALLVH